MPGECPHTRTRLYRERTRNSITTCKVPSRYFARLTARPGMSTCSLEAASERFRVQGLVLLCTFTSHGRSNFQMVHSANMRDRSQFLPRILMKHIASQYMLHTLPHNTLSSEAILDLGLRTF